MLIKVDIVGFERPSSKPKRVDFDILASFASLDRDTLFKFL